ncbi:hypothetical protein BYT27DRAFT_7185088 [Phlegmacium glaucopus]|nr:hypothetical protein BYT27DRAFT_7185088 [Phlegmacium glaucopus]
MNQKVVLSSKDPLSRACRTGQVPTTTSTVLSKGHSARYLSLSLNAFCASVSYFDCFDKGYLGIKACLMIEGMDGNCVVLFVR